MDLDFIARLLDLFERSKDLAELEVAQNGAKLRLARAAAPSVPAVVQPVAAAGPQLPAAASTLDASPLAAKSLRHEIRAGFPGTFYRAPAPGEKPFVGVGDRIAEGRQLAIVEAMKTMNPVEADRAGTVREVLLEDGTPVETGTLLFVIEPDA